MVAVSEPSILHLAPGTPDERERAAAPACFRDLNLDQLIASVTAGREAYGLRPLFYAPLGSVDEVAYRHEVFRDLEDDGLRGSVEEFARELRRMREHAEQAATLRNLQQRHRLHLDAVLSYCGAVERLAAELAERRPRSRGFTRIADFLAGLVSSAGFVERSREAQHLGAQVASLRYLLEFTPERVTVHPLGDEVDLDEAVARAFTRFGQPPRRIRATKRHASLAMGRIEAAIFERVCKRFPELFEALEAFEARFGDYLDPVVAAFDREVQFYLAYREYSQRISGNGLRFCYPELSASDKAERVVGAFDAALARSLAGDGGTVVSNDYALIGDERLLVVTGANQGGKTTFARAFGQLHVLAARGCPVPAREAKLFLADEVLTHFEQEEDARALRGKLQDELLRVQAVLERATERSVVIMNEAFSATTADDALFLGRRIMERLLALGVIGVVVTFIDELASLDDRVVSLMALVDDRDPTRRTFRIERRPADGRAHAIAIARAHELTYDELKRLLRS